MTLTSPAPSIGHNSDDLTIEVEIKLFNSIGKFSGPAGPFQKLTLPVGTTVGDIINQLHLPLKEIFLVMKNGRDISSGLVGGPINLNVEIEDGDAIAFSGPVPFSFGYGAPVV